MFGETRTDHQDLIAVINLYFWLIYFYVEHQLHNPNISLANADASDNATLSIPLSRCSSSKYGMSSSVFMFPTSSSFAIGQPPIPLSAPSNLLHFACSAASIFS